MNAPFNFSTLVLLVLVVFVFIRLYASLGVPTDRDRDLRSAMRNRVWLAVKGKKVSGDGTDGGDIFEVMEDLSPGMRSERGLPLSVFLKSLADLDSSFTTEKFLDGARIAYKLVVTAFGKGDRETLSTLVSPEVLEGFSEIMEERKERGEYVDYSSIKIDEARITEGWFEGQEAFLAVSFDSQLVSRVYKQTEDLRETFPEFDPESKPAQTSRDIWVFRRNVRSPNPNWTLVATEVD